MPPSFAIVVEWDSRQVKAALSALDPRGWQFATARALTATAQAVKAAERTGMQTSLDRPRPYTLDSLRIEPATKQHLSAFIGFKDIATKQGRLAGDYLETEVMGGTRDHVGLEGRLMHEGLLAPGRSLVPASGASLDAYGNVRRSVYAAIAADLQRGPAQRARRAGRRVRFFYGDPGHRGRGLWRAQGRTLKPFFLEVAPPTYHERFKFFQIGETTAVKAFPSLFERAVVETLRTQRP